MPDALVETKLVVPRARRRTVDRPRLDALLELGADVPLVLVSAPAGFGKTTLLATWLVRTRPARPVAWVSLDERDRDGQTFWTYVLLAVDRAVPGTATASLELLRGGQAPVEAVLTALLNELSVLPGDLTLALDDYHLAEGPSTRAGMLFLLEHLPPQVHLVVSTRADPALPLARLRARGALVEVRAADLRFTGNEAAAYLNELSALGLSPHDVALPGTPDGGVAGSAAARGVVPRRARRPFPVHRRFRRRRPVRRGLPWRTSPRRPAGGRATFPARHLRAREAHRPPV